MQDHSKGNQPTNQPYNAFNVILWHKHKRHCGFLCILYMILNTQSPAQQVLFSYIYYTYVVGNGIDWDYNPCCFMCQSWYHVRYRNIMVLQSSQLTSNAAQEEHICFTAQMNMIVAQIWCRELTNIWNKLYLKHLQSVPNSIRLRCRQWHSVLLMTFTPINIAALMQTNIASEASFTSNYAGILSMHQHSQNTN